VSSWRKLYVLQRTEWTCVTELVPNEDLDLEDFSDSGSEKNIVDSGKEFVPVDLKVDLSDSNNDIFILSLGSIQPVE